jgi:hypothetical protein
MTTITLSRQQVNQFVKLATQFKHVEWFTITEDNSSGIGSNMHVKFNMFDDRKDYDTTVDITDTITW